MSCGEECKAVLQAEYEAHGIEATVTTTPPLVRQAYEPLDLRCPHGVLWYAEPTGEQIAQWAREGVE